MRKSPKEFDYIKIKLASPSQILNWASRLLPNGQYIGEVQKSETINYRTFRPEMDGLFCERIFGPNKNFECACGKYKQIRFEGLICERCGVEVTESRVRRHRMGYVKLIYPVAHVWYINSRPNFIALLLEVEQCEKRFDTGVRDSFPTPKYVLYKPLQMLTPAKQKEFGYGSDEAYEKSTLNFYFQNLDFYFEKHEEYRYLSGKPASGTYTDLCDCRIKRIKLASIAYFIAEDEVGYYALHWDLQKYRRSREFGLTAYCLKPYPKSPTQYVRYNAPAYLLRATPRFLIGTPLIQRELKKLDLNVELLKTRDFIVTATKVINHEKPFYSSSRWFRRWESKRIYKLRDQAIKRLRLLENLIATGAKPTWMIITILPIIPPALRPMIQLEGGRFATSDLNELYRRIINRNNRLLRLLEIHSPQLIIRNEKRMLQEAIDTLIDNGKRGKVVLSANNRPLKSLSDIIKGKPGRFRQNLLGKRVDYSGRSVIVVGPSLKLNQCGLPFEMAIELFLPFIIRDLINKGLAANIQVAKDLIQPNEPFIEEVVEKLLTKHPIFLNRAPTLHRLGIQAFEPILVQGRAIKLHPLVCAAFNADFDGDQMAVHVPLSIEAQAECYMLLLSPYNFLSPANGEPIIVPSQDMVLGCYYLTVNNIKGLLGANHYFANLEDVILAYSQDQIELHASIWVRYNYTLSETSQIIKKTALNDKSYIESYENIQIRKDKKGNKIVQYLQTTPGRVIFNYTIQRTLDLLEKNI